MFKNPFSFHGRIRRLEFGLSIVVFYVSLFACGFIIGLLMGLLGVADVNDEYFSLILLPFCIPAYWFLWAQGAKRCHDRGNSGWYQIIPFYGFWMLFADGDFGINEYGPNPKGLGNETVDDIIESIGTKVD